MPEKEEHPDNNKENVKLFIVTGMSGAGKSQALKCFEDFGYYCVYSRNRWSADWCYER